MCRWHGNVWSHPGHYPILPPTPPCLLKGHCHGHEWSIYIPLIQYQWVLSLLGLGYFKLWPWKIQLKAMDEVKCQGPIVDPISNQCTFPTIHEIWPIDVWPGKKASDILKKKRKNCLKKFNIIPPTFNQVLSTTRGILLLSFVVIEYRVLTLSCRQAHFC